MPKFRFFKIVIRFYLFFWRKYTGSRGDRDELSRDMARVARDRKSDRI